MITVNLKFIGLASPGILVDETGDDGDKKEICGTVEVPNLCEDFHDCVQDVEVNVTKDDTSLAQTFPQVWPLLMQFSCVSSFLVNTSTHMPPSLHKQSRIDIFQQPTCTGPTH